MESMGAAASAPESTGVPVAAPAQARRVRHRGPPRDFLESLLVTILLALFGTTFVVQAFKIPSQSMEPTLLVGDHVLVNKFLFGGSGAWYEKLLPYRAVRRGDVIVFRFPYDDHLHYVKRVIGLPGDRIRIGDRQVYINGKRLAEPYVIHDSSSDDPFGDDFPPPDRSPVEMRTEWADEIMSYVQQGQLVVPPGHFFVMGDNRDRSSDSRYWGFVDARAIMGRPVVIYWSIEATPGDYTDRSLAGTFRGIEEALIHLPSRTRWNRMLREVH